MTWLADLTRDFRYSARSLARTPGFTVVAVIVLALGIGATSAIFSLVSAVWLKPLPFADAERVVSIWVDLTVIDGPDEVNIAPGHYADWQERARSFESMSPIDPVTLNLTGDGGEPERLTGIRSSESLFETIGLPPLLGRTFAPGDAAVNAIVVSEGFWLRRLGGDPAAIGRTITLDGTPHVIVGVVPRDFRFPQGESDVFIPTVFAPEILANHRSYVWWLVGKLRAGVPLETAQTEMNAIAATLEADYPQTGRGAAANLVPLHEHLVGEVRPMMLALIGAVAFVLLIACANVANLMLARATTRQKELAIRKALGAARGRVLRQLLAESCVLAALGVVVGILIAAVCVGYIARLIPNTFPASTSAGLNLSVVAFTVGVALVTVLLFGAGDCARARGGGALRHVELYGVAEHGGDRVTHGARCRAAHRRQFRRSLGTRHSSARHRLGASGGVCADAHARVVPLRREPDTDPATAVAVAAVLLVVTALAAFTPARRAASIDPAVTLRAEA